MSSNNIDSVLIENRQFQPNDDFVKKARVTAEKLAQLHRQAADDYE